MASESKHHKGPGDSAVQEALRQKPVDQDGDRAALPLRSPFIEERDETSRSCLLSILIVSYETRELTVECLRSLRRQGPSVAHEIIMVDNASRDGSSIAIAREFPEVRLFSMTENLGFAAATNHAARQANGDWLLLLNPDTVVLDRAVQLLLDFAVQHAQFSIFGGRTLFADGSLNPSSCWGRPTPWSAFSRAAGLAHFFSDSALCNPEAYGSWRRDRVREVDIVTGCFLLIRARTWRELGGFDPAFFMYGEDADLCLRARHLGHRAVLCPEAQIIHHGGRSERVRAEKILRLLRSKSLLVQRHWEKHWRAFGNWMLVAWSAQRMVFWTCFGRFLGTRGHEAARTHHEVWRRRAEWQV